MIVREFVDTILNSPYHSNGVIIECVTGNDEQKRYTISIGENGMRVYGASSDYTFNNPIPIDDSNFQLFLKEEVVWTDALPYDSGECSTIVVCTKDACATNRDKVIQILPEILSELNYDLEYGCLIGVLCGSKKYEEHHKKCKSCDECIAAWLSESYDGWEEFFRQ